MARLLIVVGVLLVVIGIGLSYAPWLFNWFGKLPGDIRIERENSVFLLPLTSMLIVSAIVSLIVSLFFRK